MSVTGGVTPRDAAAVTDGVTATAVEIMPPAAPRRPWLAIVLASIALGIAGLALLINGQTGWRFGTTPLASVTFAGLSLASDLLAIVLPATAVALWCARRILLAGAAWATWAIAATIATLASLGFVELHVSDTAAGRQAIVTTASELATQRADRIAAAKAAVAAAGKAKDAECTIRGPKCRTLEETERVALAALTAAIATPIAAVAPIADADPQVTATLRIATWAGLRIRTDDIVNLRLVLMALLPNVAGLLLAFATGLMPTQR